MKGKAIIPLVLFLFIFLSNFVVASDVAYIVRNADRADKGFLEAFEEIKLEVDLIADKDIKITDFSEYAFIFVGDERLRNAKKIPVDIYPSVIANGDYGKSFGLLTKGRISRLASNSKLKINMQESVIQVYDKSSFKLGGANLPYYYLPKKYKKENMNAIATTPRGYKTGLGDVISYSSEGVKKCFFGITKTKYWTQDAKNLFKECVKFVIGESVLTEERFHDVEIIKDYSNSVDGIRIKDLEAGEYILDKIAQVKCNKKYTISFKTENIGNFTENITFTGILADFDWTSLKKDLEPGKTTTTGSKTINISFAPGFYNLEISAEIKEDINLGDNFRSREVEVSC